jgi:hypothetical protein
MIPVNWRFHQIFCEKIAALKHYVANTIATCTSIWPCCAATIEIEEMKRVERFAASHESA